MATRARRSIYYILARSVRGIVLSLKQGRGLRRPISPKPVIIGQSRMRLRRTTLCASLQMQLSAHKHLRRMHSFPPWSQLMLNWLQGVFRFLTTQTGCRMMSTLNIYGINGPMHKYFSFSTPLHSNHLMMPKSYGLLTCAPLILA